MSGARAGCALAGPHLQRHASIRVAAPSHERARRQPPTGAGVNMNGDRCQTQIRLFSTDLDATLVGDAMALARFTAQWESLPAQRRPLLVYNTGRRIAE